MIFFFPKLFVAVFTEMFVNLQTQVIHKNNYYIKDLYLLNNFCTTDLIFIEMNRKQTIFL